MPNVLALQVKSARGNQICQIAIALRCTASKARVELPSVKADSSGICVQRTGRLIQRVKYRRRDEHRTTVRRDSAVSHAQNLDESCREVLLETAPRALRTPPRRATRDSKGVSLSRPTSGRREMLNGDAHQLGKRANAELRLQLRTCVGDGLVTHVEMLSDDAIGFALGDERQGL